MMTRENYEKMKRLAKEYGAILDQWTGGTFCDSFLNKRDEYHAATVPNAVLWLFEVIEQQEAREHAMSTELHQVYDLAKNLAIMLSKLHHVIEGDSDFEELETAAKYALDQYNDFMFND